MDYQPLLVTALHGIFRAASPGGSRAKIDVFADRLMLASNGSSFGECVEALLRSASVDLARLSAESRHAIERLLADEAAAAKALVAWRACPRVLAVLAADGAAEAATGLDVGELVADGVAPLRRPFDVRLTVTCETPLAHGADDRAGNAVLFRRMLVRTDKGLQRLPYYSGNALRGQLRDVLADHLLEALGLPVSRQQPALHLWFFYCLYSGGALAEASEVPAITRKYFGDNGAHRPEAYREFRQMLPALSLLGCALGNRILSGHCAVGDLRPRCREWGTGDASVRDLLAWEFLTRREDLESHAEHTGMIAYAEVLRPGTVLEGGVDCASGISDLERSALATGLRLLAKRGYLGAENRRGLGRVVMEIDWPGDDPGTYVQFLEAEAPKLRDYLRDIGALKV